MTAFTFTMRMIHIHRIPHHISCVHLKVDSYDVMSPHSFHEQNVWKLKPNFFCVSSKADFYIKTTVPALFTFSHNVLALLITSLFIRLLFHGNDLVNWADWKWHLDNFLFVQKKKPQNRSSSSYTQIWSVFAVAINLGGKFSV